MNEDQKKPLDLEHYFARQHEHYPVTRGELREIVQYFITKGSFAQSLEVFYDEIEKEIERRVQEELGAFMLRLQQGEPERSEGGIIIPT